jgi:glutathione S-transferase
MASSGTQITLHWLERSRAQRVIWLLEEVKLSYHLKTYKRLPDQQAPPSLRAVHPLGKSPVIEISSPRSAKPVVLAESANIIEYIASHFGPELIPEKWRKGQEDQIGGETDEWLRYRFYMNYAEGSLMGIMREGALKNGIKNAPVPFFIKPLTGRIAGMIETEYLNHNFESHLSFLEAELSSVSVASETEPLTDRGPFFAGSKLTAADFMMCFPLEAAQQIAGLTTEKYPHLAEYLKRVQERPGYKCAIERIIKETGSYQAGI